MKRMLPLLVLLVVPVSARPAEPPARPNIVVILADDLGRSDVGFMGCREIRTPNLDKLARAGAVLDAHYVQPVCSPTRAALMTGRYAVHTGVYTIVRPQAAWGLPLAERTLAAALHEAGYETALCGKWHLGEFEPAYRPTHRGFDHQYGHWFGSIDYFTHERMGIIDWHRDDQPCDDKGYSTQLIAQEACRRIRQKRPDKPLFLYLAFNAPHEPLEVPDSYLAAYDKLSGQRRAYAGVVTAMDEAVGQVVAALEEKGVKENTLIVFSSDNGGYKPGPISDNGPLRAGKGTIYEGGIRVCAFAAWPGHIPAATVKQPVHVVDWYPTLLKLAGAPLAQALPPDGLDVWSLLTAGARSPHDAILLCGGRPEQAAVRSGDWKLLVGANDTDAEEPAAQGAEKRARAKAARRAAGDAVELYNLAADIGERNNLAQTEPEKVKELRANLDALLKNAVPSGVPKAAASPAKPQRRPATQTP